MRSMRCRAPAIGCPQRRRSSAGRRTRYCPSRRREAVRRCVAVTSRELCTPERSPGWQATRQSRASPRRATRSVSIEVVYAAQGGGRQRHVDDPAGEHLPAESGNRPDQRSTTPMARQTKIKAICCMVSDSSRCFLTLSVQRGRAFSGQAASAGNGRHMDSRWTRKSNRYRHLAVQIICVCGVGWRRRVRYRIG